MPKLKKILGFANGPTENKKPIAGKIATGGVLLATLLLASCANYNKDHFTVGSVPDDYRTRHPIVVSESEKVVDIVVSAASRNLSFRDQELVRSVGRAFKRSGTKKVALLVPSGSRNARAAGAAAKQAVEILRHGRIRSDQIIVQHYNASGRGESATLRMTYVDLKAQVDSKCGRWEEDLFETHDNENYKNFGCATQNNLAASIAHPSDLLGPRGEANIDATRRATVIENWRANGTN